MNRKSLIILLGFVFLTLFLVTLFKTIDSPRGRITVNALYDGQHKIVYLSNANELNNVEMRLLKEFRVKYDHTVIGYKLSYYDKLTQNYRPLPKANHEAIISDGKITVKLEKPDMDNPVNDAEATHINFLEDHHKHEEPEKTFDELIVQKPVVVEEEDTHHVTDNGKRQPQYKMPQLEYHPREKYFAEQQKAIDDGIMSSCQFRNLNTQIGNSLQRRKKDVLVYDATMVNHELDLLELRMETLNDVVDYFVILEADYTFQHSPKRMFLNEKWHEKRWDKFRHKMIHTKLTEKTKERFDYWEGEVFVRNALGTHALRVDSKKINAYPKETDLIIINDLDEIINPNILKVLKYFDGYSQEIFGISYRWTYYNFYWENPKRLELCAITLFKHLVRDNFQANRLRYNCLEKERTPIVLRIKPTVSTPDTCSLGWHCSWCFPLSMYEHKVKSFPNEYDQSGEYSATKEKIRHSVNEGLWYQDDHRNAIYAKNTKDIPAVVTANPEKYRYLLPTYRPHKSCTSSDDFPQCLQGVDYLQPGAQPVVLTQRKKFFTKV